MKDLVFELKTMAYRSREGSYATQHDRRIMLMAMGRELIQLGQTSGYPQWKHLHMWQLDAKHVNALVQYWKDKPLSHKTIRNRLAALRWLAEKIGKPFIVPTTNAPYQFDPRTEAQPTSRAVSVTEQQIARISDPYIQWSLRLQAAFGLRMEESLKIRVGQADHGTTLVLQGSWCKHGRERTVLIRTKEQRVLLDQIKAFVKTKDASLIPSHLTFIEQKHKYYYQITKVGLSKLHGLRHAYAQERFLELAGFPAPLAGGPRQGDLTPEQAICDEEARAVIAEELGHGRTAIVATYIGI